MSCAGLLFWSKDGVAAFDPPRWLSQEVQLCNETVAWILRHKSLHQAICRLKRREDGKPITLKVVLNTRIASTHLCLTSMMANWDVCTELLKAASNRPSYSSPLRRESLGYSDAFFVPLAPFFFLSLPIPPQTQNKSPPQSQKKEKKKKKGTQALAAFSGGIQWAIASPALPEKKNSSMQCTLEAVTSYSSLLRWASLGYSEASLFFVFESGDKL